MSEQKTGSQFVLLDGTTDEGAAGEHAPGGLQLQYHLDPLDQEDQVDLWALVGPLLVPPGIKHSR